MSGPKYWLWLSTLRGISLKTARTLLDYFGSPKDVYFAREKHYNSAGISSQDQLSRLEDKSLEKASTIWRDCDENGIRILTMQDAEYPVRLMNIYDPPLLLYIKGRLPAIDEEVVIGMVGTRRATPYGLRTAEKLGYEVTKEGGIIVSGLADGIDTAAIRGALRANGRPIAIIGTGPDIYYPPKNKYLQDDVSSIGTLISEYPPGTAANSANFPARNRLISGISAGVAIVEAPKRSGALITAAKALEQGRDIFVVPGNIDSSACEGSNELLKDKCAVAVMSGWDIVSEYERAYPQKVKRINDKINVIEDEKMAMAPQNSASALSLSENNKDNSVDNTAQQEYIDLETQLENLSEDELSIVSVLDKNEMHIDDIIEISGKSPSLVLAALTSLEIKGYAAAKKGRRYSLVVTKGKA